MMRIAAVDIGTNSIRSVVAELSDDGGVRIIDDEKVTVRLGEGMTQGGEISAAARTRAIEALSRLSKIIRGYGAESVTAVATSALRKASNGREFLGEIRERVGLSVEIISGEMEAELAVLSAFKNFEMEGGRFLVADIGGGSLELALTAGHHMEQVASLDLGAVYMTERFLPSVPPQRSELKALRRHVRKVLDETFADDKLPPVHSVIGSGGTIVSMGTMTMAARKERYDSVQGYELLRSDVVHLHAMLSRKSGRELRVTPGLNPDRADIIVAGVTVIDELMDFFGVNLIKVNDRGIREGMILQELRRRGAVAGGDENRSWRTSVLDLARSCHADERHALHVASLSRCIAESLSPMFRFSDRELRLLEGAAILHDIGYFINYSSHHKHSYHLIRHAPLFGFTPREREMMAQIARYHRKALPRRKHEEFMKLSPEDQLLVSRLAGILRLSDGLDRRRNSIVTVDECILSPSRLLIRITGDDDLSVELFGARQKGDLLEEAFGLKLTVQHSTKQ